MDEKLILRIEDMDKSFPGVKALDKVKLTLNKKVQKFEEATLIPDKNNAGKFQIFFADKGTAITGKFDQGQKP